MKNKYPACLAVLLLIFGTACAPEAPTAQRIEGTYELVATLFDPGDGSGTFQPVDSDFQVTFAADGTFSANGPLCEYRAAVLSQSEGTYDVGERRLLVRRCYSGAANDEVVLGLDWQGLVVQIGLFCDEPCLLQLEKVSD